MAGPINRYRVRRNLRQDRQIPRQDRRICGSICFFQLIVVLSCVSLIYLTVAVYIPYYKALNSGYEIIPIICQTVNANFATNCSWSSCREWCLSKTSSSCPQIHVTTRQTGTNLQLEHCTKIISTFCPQLQQKSDGLLPDKSKHNKNQDGNCDTITTDANNVFISMDDTVYMAKCSRAVATTIANGNEPSKKIEPTIVWKSTPNHGMMLSCTHISSNSTTIDARDCLNGTILNLTDVPSSINFSTFWNLRDEEKEPVDPTQRFLPMQSVLTIYNNSRLYINLDGCVNTLQGECNIFFLNYGKASKNQTSQPTFPCYYNKNNPLIVVTRYDLEAIKKQLIITISVPTIIFFTSFAALCTLMRVVKVGDDAKMRLRSCVGNTDPDFEMTILNRRCEVPGPLEGPSWRRDTSFLES